jgi:hypothetical protein
MLITALHLLSKIRALFTLSFLLYPCLLHFFFPLIFARTSSPYPLHFSSWVALSQLAYLFHKSVFLHKHSSSEPILVVFILSYAQNLFKLLGRLVQQVVTKFFIYNNFGTTIDHHFGSSTLNLVTHFTFINRSQLWINFLQTMFI